MELILIPIAAGMAAVLMMIGVAGLSPHQTRGMAAAMVAVAVIVMTVTLTAMLLIRVIMMLEIVLEGVEDLRATMGSETEIRMLPETPDRTTTPRTILVGGTIPLVETMLVVEVRTDPCASC